MAAADAARDEAVADEVLIREISEGRREAFDVLYERYFPRVYRFIESRMRNRADTEETVQEVFINVFSSLASFRAEAPFGAWVLGVARRTLASRFKRKRHATVPFDGDDEQVAVDIGSPIFHREPSPHEHYEYGERVTRLRAAAARLSDEQRVLFDLHHLQNLSIHEIALRLHKSEDAVKSNLYRARRVLLAV
jgi:RNA polymerase sigma-70 factor (ECF subfamily)